MIDGVLVLTAGLVGLAVGLALAPVLRRGAGAPASPSPAPRPEVDDGAVAVLAVLRSATVVTDANGRVVRSDDPARSLGLVRENRVAPQAVRRMIEDVAGDGEIRDAEVEVPRGLLGGGTFLLQVRVAPLGPRHVVVLADDRTEARRLDEIRRDFVVNVSHELKTPVGALSLLAETVDQAADEPDAVRRFARRIGIEADRLSHLVQEIIELSRLQERDSLGHPDLVDIDDVVTEAVDRARTAAAAKSIDLVPGRASRAAVRGNPDLLVTAVRNLLDNAVAYSDPRTRVAVGTTVRPDEGVVEIAVVDQGVGIPAEAQPRLFERFYRVDPARSRETGGTGLGLSIVKHVVADHGGDVTVWSQQGQGSTFTIRLPLAHRGVTP